MAVSPCELSHYTATLLVCQTRREEPYSCRILDECVANTGCHHKYSIMDIPESKKRRQAPLSPLRFSLRLSLIPFASRLLNLGLCDDLDFFGLG